MGTLFLAALFFLQAAQPEPKVEPRPVRGKEMQALSHMTDGTSRSVMLIDPKARASDYKKAFEILKQEKSTAKVYFELSDGMKISHCTVRMRDFSSRTLRKQQPLPSRKRSDEPLR